MTHAWFGRCLHKTAPCSTSVQCVLVGGALGVNDCDQGAAR